MFLGIYTSISLALYVLSSNIHLLNNMKDAHVPTLFSTIFVSANRVIFD